MEAVSLVLLSRFSSPAIGCSSTVFPFSEGLGSCAMGSGGIAGLGEGAGTPSARRPPPEADEGRVKAAEEAFLIGACFFPERPVLPVKPAAIRSIIIGPDARFGAATVARDNKTTWNAIDIATHALRFLSMPLVFVLCLI